MSDKKLSTLMCGGIEAALTAAVIRLQDGGFNPKPSECWATNYGNWVIYMVAKIPIVAVRLDVAPRMRWLIVDLLGAE